MPNAEKKNLVIFSLADSVNTVDEGNNVIDLFAVDKDPRIAVVNECLQTFSVLLHYLTEDFGSVSVIAIDEAEVKEIVEPLLAGEAISDDEATFFVNTLYLNRSRIGFGNQVTGIPYEAATLPHHTRIVERRIVRELKNYHLDPKLRFTRLTWLLRNAYAQ